MIAVCIRENQAGSRDKMMRCICIERDYSTHVVVSPEVKKVLLDQLLEIATSTPSTAGELDFINFRGRWASNGVHWHCFSECQADLPRSSEGAADQPSSSGSAAQEALQNSAIRDLDFVSSAILWHFVTDICLQASPAVPNETGCVSRMRRSSEELSNYIMYLVVKCNVMLGSDGHYVVKVARRDVMLFLGMVADRTEFIQKVRDGDLALNLKEFPALHRAHRVSSELLKMNAHNRWKLIALVWVEMLCYVAHNCGSGFHAKHLSTGGEFVTHVKIRDRREKVLQEHSSRETGMTSHTEEGVWRCEWRVATSTMLLSVLLVLGYLAGLGGAGRWRDKSRRETVEEMGESAM
ncbi:hypothetical protein EJB05_34706, partial [Eragrostis curvula]